jgi:hypothetical protein
MIDFLITIGPPLLVFSGIVLFGTCQFRAGAQHATFVDFIGASVGSLLIVAGFSMIVGA